jgi:hypothetical protein
MVEGSISIATWRLLQLPPLYASLLSPTAAAAAACCILLFSLQEPNNPLSMAAYWGVYMLQEPVTRDKHRVDIEKYQPEIDPSGVHSRRCSCWRSRRCKHMVEPQPLNPMLPPHV